MLGHHKWKKNGDESDHYFNELNDKLELLNLKATSRLIIYIYLVTFYFIGYRKEAKNNMTKFICLGPCLYFLCSVLNGYDEQ